MNDKVYFHPVIKKYIENEMELDTARVSLQTVMSSDIFALVSGIIEDQYQIPKITLYKTAYQAVVCGDADFSVVKTADDIYDLYAVTIQKLLYGGEESE